MGRLRRALGRLARRITPRPVAAPAAPARPTPTPEPVVLDHCALAELAEVRRACTPRGRPLLINHWATWCEGCVAELPLLVEVHHRWAEHLDFLGVSWDRFQPRGTPASTVRDVQRMAMGYGVTWKNLVFDGAPEALFEGLSMAVHTVPQTLLLDPGGAVIWSADMPLEPGDVATLEAAIATLLGEG